MLLFTLFCHLAQRVSLQVEVTAGVKVRWCLRHLFAVTEQEDEEQTGTLLVEDRDEESGESDDEDNARLQLQPTRKAAWVDEDDELEEV